MSLLFAVDDGIAQGNLNWADIFFLVGAIMAVLGGILAYASMPSTTPPVARWPTPLAYVGLGLIGFGLFLL
jgi:hypothetical protein